MPTVSIVIVCMNNLQNLRRCLDSIQTHTSVSYETLVVAYLFTRDNLAALRVEYPWVAVIESHELRGFAENNNLALRQTTGDYCFVLNDDTYFDVPVIDHLVAAFAQLPDTTAVVSPVTYTRNGNVQHCGRPKYSLGTLLLDFLRLGRFYRSKSVYTGRTGLFKTYNLYGAAFMITRSVFEKVGWFDERYFFCPEDIALSTKLNREGYSCYVASEVGLTHLGGESRSPILCATVPAAFLGDVIFYEENYFGGGAAVRILNALFRSLYFVYWSAVSAFTRADYAKQQCIVNLNVLRVVFSRATPKEAFKRFR